MLNFIVEKKNCTACSACLSICPVNCISMKSDEEGFLYPEADRQCISCGKCEKVCPIASNKIHKKSDIKQFAVAALHKDLGIWYASSSGGAFSAISKAFSDESTIIYGAAFDGLTVKHGFVEGYENISAFRKSKYIESDIGSCFTEIRRFLELNRRVLFSGTPCQVAGLKNYLNKEYDNLFCLDFICHGVASPKIFNDWLKHLSLLYKNKIIKYSFRVKHLFAGFLDVFICSYEFENGRKINNHNDLFFRGFLLQLYNRPSCGVNCCYCSRHRYSDITIADLRDRGYVGVIPELKERRNFSLIIFNSTKGKDLYSKINNLMKFFPRDMKKINRFNPNFFKNNPGNPERSKFFSVYADGVGVDTLLNKYFPKPEIKMISRVIKYIPHWLRNKIKFYLLSLNS